MSETNYELISAIEDITGICYTGKNTDEDAEEFINKYKKLLWEFNDFTKESHKYINK